MTARKNDVFRRESRIGFGLLALCLLSFLAICILQGCRASAPTPPPAPPAAGAPTREVVLVSADFVYFPFDSATPQDYTSNHDVGSMAAPYILVEGHADVRGPVAYNLALSRRRAEAVARELVKEGTPEEIIQIEARGEAAPVCLELVEACHLRNRRVVVSVLREGEAAP